MKMTFGTIVFGGVIVFLAVVAVAVFVPSLIWNPQETTVAHAYTPEQAQGRERNNCLSNQALHEPCALCRRVPGHQIRVHRFFLQITH